MLQQKIKFQFVELYENAETYHFVIASQFANWRGNPFPRHSKNAIARQGNLLDKLEFDKQLYKGVL